MARRWRDEHPMVELDEAVIYFRCGDVFTLPRLVGYGIVPYHVYRRVLPPAVASIGIVTGRTSGACREGEGR